MILHFADLQFHHGPEPIKNYPLKKIFKGAFAAGNIGLVKYVFAQEEKKYLNFSPYLLKACKQNLTEIAIILINNKVECEQECIYYIYKHNNKKLMELIDFDAPVLKFNGACAGSDQSLITKTYQGGYSEKGFVKLCKKNFNHEMIDFLKRHNKVSLGLYGACSGGHYDLAISLEEKFSYNKALKKACKGGNISLISRYAKKATLYEEGINECCKRNNIEGIKIIKNYMDSEYELYFKVKHDYGYEAVVQMINYITDPRDNILDLCFRGGTLKLIKLIISHYDMHLAEIPYQCYISGSLDIVEFFAEKFNLEYNFEELLIGTIKLEKYEFMEKMLSKGLVDLDKMCDKKDFSPKKKIFGPLIKHGFKNLNLPFIKACRLERITFIIYLLKNYKDYSFNLGKGLEIAIKKKNLVLIELLIDFGAVIKIGRKNKIPYLRWIRKTGNHKLSDWIKANN
jgi:hypothetical protein